MANEGFFGKLLGSATPWGAIATGVNTLFNIGGAIGQSIKRNKLQKQWDALYAERPTYEISQGYKDALKTYQRLANQGLPGQNLIEQNIQQASARARTAAERGAISSTAYGALTSDIYDKELQAIQDLGIKAAEYQTQAQQQLAAGQQMMGTQEEKAQEWNKIGKWTTGMNALESKMGVAAQNAANRWENVGAGLQNFAGTQYYMQALKMMNPSGGNADDEYAKRILGGA